MRPKIRLFRILGAASVLAIWLGTAGPLLAQVGGTVRGTVTDRATARPLGGTRIVLVGQNRETRTNDQGVYEMGGITPGTYMVRALYVGFARMEMQVTVSVGQTATADFAMNRAPIQLQEIVVTGTPGGTEKRALGNAITSIKADVITEVAPVATVQELLQARSPGLTFYKNAGSAGSSSNVRIRGAGSLEAGYNPVYYIDGIRFESNTQQTVDSEWGGAQGTSPLDFINPEDIESIEVIKGPAAATLYGADAAAGVIQIFTKKGSRGTDRMQWTTSFEYGQSDWTEGNVGNPSNFWLCELDDIADPNRFPGCADPSSVVWTGPNGVVTGIPESDITRLSDGRILLTDDPLRRHPSALRSGDVYDFALSARGGGQLFNYFLSFNRYDEDGVFLNNFHRRTGGRANFEFTPNERLNFSVNFGYGRTHTQIPLNNNASNGILRNSFRGRARASNDPWEAGFRGLGPDQANLYDNQSREERTTIGLTTTWQPFSWFNHRLTLGLDKYDRRDTEFDRIDTTGMQPFGATAAAGRIQNDLPVTHTWTVDYAGSARFPLTSTLSSNFSAGMQLNARQRRRFSTDGQGLVANQLNLTGSAAQTFGDEAFVEQTSLGFYLQEEVGWRDRLFVTGAVRIDDNSAFGSDFSLVVYPKASVSYVISDEDFFNVGVIDQLKLRFAWGQAGNAPAPFTADRTFTTDVTTIADISVNTLTPSEFGNPDLKAETGSEWELGFDTALLNGRAGIELTYYNQNTKDALIAIADPPSSGFSGQHFINIGEVSNTGFEALMTGNPILGRNFVWDVNFSISTNKNRLVDFGSLPDGSPVLEEVTFGSFASVQRHREGYPLGGFWAVDVVRDAAGNPVLDAGGDVTVDFECSWPDTDDPNGFGGTCHEKYMGPSLPTVEMGFSNIFTLFGNLRLFTHFDFKGGHYQWCAICSIRNRIDQNTWEVNNPDADPVQVALWKSRQTLTHIFPADFLKLREIAVTYTLPESFGNFFRATKWSVTLSGRNLWMWTRYEGTGDPEVNFWSLADFTRLDYASLPQTRRLAASIRVTY